MRYLVTVEVEVPDDVKARMGTAAHIAQCTFDELTPADYSPSGLAHGLAMRILIGDGYPEGTINYLRIWEQH
jgi:hypothetical protein